MISTSDMGFALDLAPPAPFQSHSLVFIACLYRLLFVCSHPSWGNYGIDSLGECGVPTFQRFHMPDNGHSLFWYSFNYGSVHILHMSTEHDFTPGSDQYDWIVSDLAAVDRAVTPWVVFAGHRYGC